MPSRSQRADRRIGGQPLKIGVDPVLPSTSPEMAGREGFEPSDEVKPRHPLSRRALSATQPPPRTRVENRV